MHNLEIFTTKLSSKNESANVENRKHKSVFEKMLRSIPSACQTCTSTVTNIQSSRQCYH